MLIFTYREMNLLSCFVVFSSLVFMFCGSQDVYPASVSVDEYNPNYPLILCDNLDDCFIDCSVIDLSEVSDEDYNEDMVGCRYYGCTSDNKPLYTEATCTVLEGIDCVGNRTFTKTVPCIRYNGYQFTTALLLSMFLGVFGADRFYLGYIFSGIVKMMTLGGFGFYYLIDLVLLVQGKLLPADGSSWEGYY